MMASRASGEVYVVTAHLGGVERAVWIGRTAGQDEAVDATCAVYEPGRWGRASLTVTPASCLTRRDLAGLGITYPYPGCRLEHGWVLPAQ